MVVGIMPWGDGGQPIRSLRLEDLLRTVCVGRCVHVGISYYD